jgi:hypothetical protein
MAFPADKGGVVAETRVQRQQREGLKIHQGIGADTEFIGRLFIACVFDNAMIQYKCFNKLTHNYQNEAHSAKRIQEILAV